MKHKKNVVVINPGILSDILIANEQFPKNYKILYINLINKSLTEFDYELKKCDQIIIDDLDSANLNDNDISLINYYRVVESKSINVSEVFEKYYKRVPVTKILGKWSGPKELLNIKISKHIEFSKRITDTFLIITLLPIIIFLLFIGIILIKLTSKGPIFFKQERVGKNGKPFLLYKLRTMVYSKNGHISHTIENDERIFPVGKFLRFSKIDELPQCLNVLLGHMSIIGPRPERTEIVKMLALENPYYELRHLIRPGITGWAQVNNPTATPTQNFEKLEYDLYYIKNANLALEFFIILKTVQIIIKRNSL
jgi:lipopolysaccharide/colanic/teichoic acid biosynthesis glycosyltransferase